MSTDNVDWPEGDDWRPTRLDNYLASGSADGKVYVLAWGRLLTDAVTLFTFDPCADSWTRTEQSYSTGDIWQVCTAGGPRWLRDHFQCGKVGASAALIWPNDPALHVVPAATVLAPPPWELPPSDYRRPAQAATSEFALAWGGALSAAGVWSPTNDGRLYSFRLQAYTSTTLTGALTPRYLPQLVALGDRFFIWGGFAAQANSSAQPDSALVDGAIYDPRTDRFAPISSDGAPAQSHAEALDRDPIMAAFSNGTDVFVVDTTTGAGGVYASTLDRWFPLNATQAPFDLNGVPDWYVAQTTRDAFHVLGNGDLIWIGPSESRLAPKRGGNWQSFTQGNVPPPPPLQSVQGRAVGSGYSVKQWTGTALVHWGPWAQTSIGCDSPPPPGTGCDPLSVTQNRKFGQILWAPALIRR